MRQKCCIKLPGIRGSITESQVMRQAWSIVGGGGEGLDTQTHLHSTSGQLWAQPDTNLVEDVEVPLTGGLAGHSSFL